ncbi:MAG: hypothetical protein DIU69_11560 [Bacillota bacterium]|nr:MAG: hypothetical protein DIU69_11560 [Bacillota bacterium]
MPATSGAAVSGLDEADIYFPSEKSRLLGLLLWSPILALPYVVFTGGPWLPMLIGLSVYLLLIPWMWFRTGYRVTETRLFIKAGPLEWDVALSSIRCVRPTFNPINAPALSLRRLAITLDNGDVILISPADRDRFVALLRERCPHACFKT